ncbi:MAG: hypothetical protein LBC83_00545 [Oscillospiraceae bacterium]|jgi:putative aldouronate transport system substrate-binding protein|nr:hypothetical protein [Oscillospiraceae bacterium]
MKRNAKKRGKSIKILAIVLVVALAAGAGVFFFLTRSEPLKIAARSTIITHWDQQGITKYFEAKLNVKIKWIDYGTDSAEIYAHLQRDIGAETKDLPDFYLGLGLEATQLDALLRQNMFLNFNGMVKDYAPELQKIINSDISRKAEMMQNGGLYSFPSLNEQYAEEYPQKAWINNTWLLRTKQSVPTTPEQLLAVLRAFKTGDPNGNGIADEIPLGAACRDAGSSAAGTSLGYLVQPFVTTDYDLTETNYLNVRDGKIYAGVMEPGYKSALQYLNTLYSEGLVDQTVFSQGSEVFLRASREAETYGVILAKDINALFNDPERAAAYVPLPPLTKGDQRSTLVRRSKINSGGLLIPNRIALERQKIALAFGDAMLSDEGSLTVCYGSENTGWFKADGGTALGGSHVTWRLAPEAVDSTAIYSGLTGAMPYWLDAQLQMERQAKAVNGGNVLQTTANWAGYLNKVTKENYEETGRACLQYALPELVAGDSTESLPHAAVVGYLTQASRDFVTGRLNLETEWSAYLAALKEKGVEKILQAVQSAYTREMQA